MSMVFMFDTYPEIPPLVQLMVYAARQKQDEEDVKLQLLAQITVGLPQYIAAECTIRDATTPDGTIRVMKLSVVLVDKQSHQYEISIPAARNPEIDMRNMPYKYREAGIADFSQN